MFLATLKQSIAMTIDLGHVSIILYKVLYFALLVLKLFESLRNVGLLETTCMLYEKNSHLECCSCSLTYNEDVD